MFALSSTSLAAYAFLALFLAAVDARPATTHVINENHVRIPFVRRHNLTGTSLVASDRARASFFKNRHTNTRTAAPPGTGVSGPSAFFDVTNTVVSYLAEVKVGSQTFDLIVDTGSSNTWVGATTEYRPGRTAQDTGSEVVSD